MKYRDASQVPTRWQGNRGAPQAPPETLNPRRRRRRRRRRALDYDETEAIRATRGAQMDEAFEEPQYTAQPSAPPNEIEPIAGGRIREPAGRGAWGRRDMDYDYRYVNPRSVPHRDRTMSESTMRMATARRGEAYAADAAPPVDWFDDESGAYDRLVARTYGGEPRPSRLPGPRRAYRPGYSGERRWRGDLTQGGFGAMRKASDRYAGETSRGLIDDEDNVEARYAWSSPGRAPRRRRAEGADHRGVGPRGYERSPRRIREEICERLMHARQIDPSEIDVEVDNRGVAGASRTCATSCTSPSSVPGEPEATSLEATKTSPRRPMATLAALQHGVPHDSRRRSETAGPTSPTEPTRLRT